MYSEQLKKLSKEQFIIWFTRQIHKGKFIPMSAWTLVKLYNIDLNNLKKL